MYYLKSHTLSIVLATLILTFNLALHAETALPAKYERCGSCHGSLGVSSYTYFPNIAGQKMTYLVNQLKAFRDGKRDDPWMTPMATDLTDEEIKALANFYSKL